MNKVKSATSFVAWLVIGNWIICRLANAYFMTVGGYSALPAFWAGVLLDTVAAGLAVLGLVLARKNAAQGVYAVLGSIVMLTFINEFISSVLNGYSFVETLPYVTPIVDIYFNFQNLLQNSPMLVQTPMYILVLLGWTIAPALLQLAAISLLVIFLTNRNKSEAVTSSEAAPAMTIPQSPSAPMQYSSGSPVARFDPMTGKPLDHGGE